MFLLILFLITFFKISSVTAWNPDYAYNLPQQRRMCVKRDSDETIRFYSILSDEDCPPDARRYLVVFAKEPPGGIALVPTTTSLRYYPPLTVQWPPKEKLSSTPLWHFTCLKNEELEVLDSKIPLQSYRGEITSSGKLDCFSAAERALKYCKKEYQGDSLLEQCPL